MGRLNPTTLVTLILGSIITLSQQEVIQLGRLNVAQWPVTGSGFSSGGNIMIQMQVAFSACWNATAVFAAVPYLCGQSHLGFGYYEYRVVCNFLSDAPGNIYQTIEEAKELAKAGKIDPLSNLANQRHFHCFGKKDSLVLRQSNVRANTKELYLASGMKKDNIKLVPLDSDHWMPTKNKSLPECTTFNFFTKVAFSEGTTGCSYCNYYGALEALRFVFGPTEIKEPTGPITLQPLKQFDQTKFVAPENTKYLGKIGYLYVPAGCKQDGANCKFHMVCHGCRGSRDAIGDGFVFESGYLPVAEVNNIVLLFPQSTPLQTDVLDFSVGNPDGCWDAFGYTNEAAGDETTGATYATKKGIQMRALMQMIQTVTGITGCTD